MGYSISTATGKSPCIFPAPCSTSLLTKKVLQCRITFLLQSAHRLQAPNRRCFHHIFWPSRSRPRMYQPLGAKQTALPVDRWQFRLPDPAQSARQSSPT